jgi:ring-1,2-phenylacetyl-CoA epoxidase subunit PaaC
MSTAAHLELLLRIGDTLLVHAQQLGRWVGNAPTLEEELAIANHALDVLGQATRILDHAADVEAGGRTADDLAYLRETDAYRNLLLVELDNGDFADLTVRRLLVAVWAQQLWGSLQASDDSRLAAIAAKAARECDYHVRHAGDWLVRLGDGTDESRARTVAALDRLWPYTGEAFLDDDVDQAVADAGLAPLPSTLRAGFDQVLDGWLDAATLERPADVYWQRGGRQGLHTEHLGYILAEMQVLQRAHPGATW